SIRRGRHALRRAAEAGHGRPSRFENQPAAPAGNGGLAIPRPPAVSSHCRKPRCVQESTVSSYLLISACCRSFPGIYLVTAYRTLSREGAWLLESSAPPS